MGDLEEALVEEVLGEALPDRLLELRRLLQQHFKKVHLPFEQLVVVLGGVLLDLSVQDLLSQLLDHLPHLLLDRRQIALRQHLYYVVDGLVEVEGPAFVLMSLGLDLKQKDLHDLQQRHHLLLPLPLHNHFFDLLAHLVPDVEILAPQNGLEQHLSNVFVLGDEDDGARIVVDDAGVQNDEEVLDELALVLERLDQRLHGVRVLVLIIFLIFLILLVFLVGHLVAHHVGLVLVLAELGLLVPLVDVLIRLPPLLLLLHRVVSNQVEELDALADEGLLLVGDLHHDALL
mmetsp:Transcript_9591/g.9232  ORF Transcript_9591/g.9232 Transcript_9591/m.9232 type:complete len:288 (-) Transcript_9591:1321-2184(-)